MKFKEYIKSDIGNTFINNNEFAEEKKINGATVLVIEDSDKLESRIKSDYNGLIIGDILFYISSDEYAKIPRVNDVPTTNMALNYDGIRATVTNVGKQSGIYEIILQTAGGY